MASIQRKGDAFYCQFLWHGKRHTVTVGKVNEGEAEAFGGSVDLILLRLKQNLLTLPSGTSITDFILSGGKAPAKVSAIPKKLTFNAFWNEYLIVLGLLHAIPGWTLL